MAEHAVAAARPRVGRAGAAWAPPAAPRGAAGAGAFAAGLGLALGLLLCLRLLTVQLSGAGLHVDEAQYWDWSRSLQWGYWSKPPGVAAVIAASTALFGDGVPGLRLLGMACWIASAAVLAALAWRMAGAPATGPGAAPTAPTAAPGTAHLAAAWTAAMLCATPASGLLGLVVTTDGPLMLCWSCALLAAWAALSAETRGRSPWPAWAAVGLAVGLGLLSKYTTAALALSAVPLLWMRWQQAGRADARGLARLPWRTLAGLALATALALLLWLPNLAWNARHGWPTLAHTAAITAQAEAGPGRGPLGSLLEFLAGQLLLIGPVACVLAWRLHRRPRPQRQADGEPAARAAERFALAVSLPLLGVGVLQSLNAKAQMNWTAPMLAGLSLWLGLRAGRSGLRLGSCVASAAAGVALTTALALAASAVPGLAGRSADIWARMRGWDETLVALAPVLLQQQARAALPVVAQQRDVLVQARRAWRGLPASAREVRAWPAEGVPQNHYEQFQPLVAPGTAAPGWPAAVLVLCEDEPQAAQRARYAHWQRLAEARAPSGRRLSLWRADQPVAWPTGGVGNPATRQP